ncbi:type VII secretion protein EccCa [Nocardia sp. SSK8]|uniref:type VII secretion protein EccCa n=1 Tax=Nocardia sp. SSK8 TaxID=3120154 RepID=UPI00300A46AA
MLLPAPPVSTAGSGSSGAAMRVLLPMLGAVGAASMMLSNNNPLRMIAGGAMVAAALLGGIAALVFFRSGARKKMAEDRTRCIDYLRQTRGELDADGETQRAAAVHRHPAPVQLPQLVRDPLRVWERRRRDADFLVVRAGFGNGDLARPVSVRGQENPLQPNDPVAQAHLDQVLARTRSVADIPMAVPLRGVVSIVGPPEQATALVRAMLMQVVSLHAPDDVRIHLALGATEPDGYDWLAWLPHLLDTRNFDGPIGRRMTSRSVDELAAELDDHLRRRIAIRTEQLRLRPGAPDYPGERLLIVVPDSGGTLDPQEFLPPGYAPAELGICVITLNEQRRFEPSHVDVRVRVTADSHCAVELVTAPESRPGDLDSSARDEFVRTVLGARTGVVDDAPPALAAGLARYLAPLRLAADPEPDAPLETVIGLHDLLGVPDFGTYDIERMWQPKPLSDFLNVPFGLDAAGKPVRLDIKESGQQGMGPHGLCIGATGSGKSEVLRTLVVGQAVAHSPERLAFVLVDYKGGAAFAGLDDLPHTTAMVSNLADDAGLVDRLHDALLGELQRRQRVLQDAGSLPNVTEYNVRRDAGQDLPPLPNLFVVIDEFGEILSAKPDFIDLFVQIGRIGRSVGVHLLLATQRLEEGRLRGLESHLSYRIGLRTFTAQESRAALGIPDAHSLPPVPGSGILKVDPDICTRFKAAYVSGVYEPTEDKVAAEIPPVPMPFGLFNDTAEWLRDRADSGPARPVAQVDRFAATTLDVVVSRMRQAAAQVQQIWLPPLPTQLDFTRVLGPIAVDGERGLTTVDRTRHASLRIPLGLLDKPLEQWQGPFTVDLRAAGGNVCILGAPQSGKTGALRSLVIGAALTHTPREVAFYAVDLGGSALTVLERLPHVGGVATRFDPDRIRRTIAEVKGHLTRREAIYAAHRIDSADELRRRHARGSLPELEVADIFLVVDGWATLKDEYEDLLPVVQEIGARGLGFGVHLVLTTGRWADLRLPMQAVIGTKIELRLNDPLDSTISRKIVENIRADTPGRCVGADKLLAQISLPVLSDDGGLTDQVAATVAAIAEAWPGPQAPEVRMLPTRLRFDEHRARNPGVPSVLLGVDEAELGPVTLDLLGGDQHLLVFGDAESGKTNLARVIIAELIGQRRDDEVVLALFDVRRTLLDEVPDQYLGAYAGTQAAGAGIAGGIAGELAKRLPPEDVTPAQLRDRSWWNGPEIFVIADDFDLLSPSGPGPLAALLPYLPHARDIGLHLLVFRRSGGAARALFEPVIQALKEQGATGILLSGDRQEGQIWPGAAMSTQVPGRGLLVRRGRAPVRFQIALREAAVD